MRILHVDAFSAPFVQDNTGGLFKAFTRVAETQWFDYRADVKRHAGKPNPAHVDAMNRRLVAKARAFQPDLLHLSKAELVKPGIVHKIRGEVGCIITHMVGDWRPEPMEWAVGIGQHADITLFQHRDEGMNQRYLDAGCNRIEFWPSGVDEKVFRPRDIPKRYPVVFMANWPLRPLAATSVGRKGRAQFVLDLAKLGIEIHLFGNSAERMAAYHENLHGYSFVESEAFAHTVSSAKIALGYNAGGGYCYTSWPRPLKSMACGCMYVTRYFDGLETVFRNVEHLVWHNTTEAAAILINYYLSADDERETIARTGMGTVRKDHTWRVRVRQLLEMTGVG